MCEFNKNNDRIIKNTSLGIKLKICIIGDANENEKKMKFDSSKKVDAVLNPRLVQGTQHSRPAKQVRVFIPSREINEDKTR